MENITKNTLVSIVIPAYNTASFIGRALKGVLSQTYQNFEVIIVDDCSTDNLAGVLSTFNDKRIHVYHHAVNRGGSAARNTGISHTKGEYVAFLDSDDEWLPTKLEKQLKVFQSSSSEVGMVYTGWRWIKGKDGIIIQYKIPAHRGNLHQLSLSGDCIGSMSTPLIKTVLLHTIGGFDEKLPARQDWDLWLRLSKICMFDFVHEVLVNYYVHPESISGKNLNKIRGTEIVIEKYHDEFKSMPSALAGHYIVLTILYLIDGNVTKAREMMRKSIQTDPRNWKIYWKNLVHITLSILPRPVRIQFFKTMRFINKDFYWFLLGA
ncbi:MAG: glycosyltransferase family 2 protein [Ignavibacteriales bacterium]|nr:glycosyltransferase family 2 protein [Ignavibacteriales bacterium]